MDNFKSTYALIIAFLLIPALLSGQQNEYDWRIGVYGGVMSYYGDLSHELIEPNRKLINISDNLDYLSYGLSLERRLSNAFSFGLIYTDGQFVANDRKINWDGELQTAHPRFERSLNARTEIQDVSAYFTYHFDNGDLLGIRSIVSPYLKAGLGLTQFGVYGDLFYGPKQQQRYYYWDDNTIRGQPPESPGAMVIEQDGEFETRLDGLQTEGVDYDTRVLSAGAALGLKFHLGRFNINLESHWRWVSTDYLDDVSGDFPTSYNSDLQRYASNPAGIEGPQRGSNSERNDIYAFTSISLHYNFARKEGDFHIPPIALGPLTGSDRAAASQQAGPDTNLIVQDTMHRKDTAFAKIAADSLQRLVDSLRTELSQMKTGASFVDSLVADSLRERADSLRSVADSLQQQAEQLYPSPEKQSRSAVEQPMDTVSWMEAPPSFRDTLRVVDETPAAPDTSSMRATPDAPLEPSVQETPAPDTSARAAPIDTSSAVQAEPVPKREDQNDTSITDVRIIQDTIMRQEINHLEEQLAQLNASVQQLQQEVATPAPVPDSLATEQQIERYREDLQTLRQEMENREEEVVERTEGNIDREEQRKLLNDYASTLEEMESARLDDRERYQELNKELERLRRQLNITTAAGAATGAAALATRPKPSDTDTLIQSLQSRMDSLERANRQAPPDSPAAPSDSSTNQLRLQIERLERRLDSLRQSSATSSPALPDSIRTLLHEQGKLIEDLQTQIALLKETEIPAETTTVKNVLEQTGDRAHQAVFFDSGSSTLGPAARQTVNDMVRLLQEYPELMVRLEGYTDSSGSIQLNRRLAARRTQAVRDYLVSNGINEQRIITAPQGIDRNANTATFGRRVELELWNE